MLTYAALAGMLVAIVGAALLVSPRPLGPGRQAVAFALVAVGIATSAGFWFLLWFVTRLAEAIGPDA